MSISVKETLFNWLPPLVHWIQNKINGGHFEDNIFNYIFFEENLVVSTEISLDISSWGFILQ